MKMKSLKDRKSTRLNSSHVAISYAVFCLKSSQINSTQYFFPTRRSSDLEAITLDNDYKVAVIFLVNILKEENKIDEIIDLINELKRMGAEDPEYDWELALAYNENEEFEKAYDYYKLAYELLQSDSIFLKEYGYLLV